MVNWWEAGDTTLPTTASKKFEVTVTDLGLTTPSISASRAMNVTNPSNVTDVADTIFGGSGPAYSATITTTLWTTPLISNLTVGNTYRIEADISDGAEVITVTFLLKAPY